MGLEVGAIAAIVTAVAAVGGATAGVVSGNQQRAAARHSADLQQQARDTQRADNVAKAAQERRQQIRDERIRQARIEQASANTGATGSSGELGALSSITTQTQANVGANLGSIQRVDEISIFNQQAADTTTAGMNAAGTTSIFGGVFNGIGGGASAFSRASRPTATPGTYDPSFDNPNNYG